MPLITSQIPESWEQLELLVTAILSECGMEARRQIALDLPRGTVDVDVLAEENVDGIIHRTICECKNWQHNIPKDVVHAFRTVMQETGAHRGYIVSKVGFQSGAILAAHSTNIELVTFAEFQEKHFEKWIKTQLWAIEEEIGAFNTYYEPLGPPGYSKLANDEERAAYDAVFEKYAFAGLMLQPFSPYLRIARPYPLPPLPFNVAEIEARGLIVPDDIKVAAAYREFFRLLVAHAKKGLAALRAVNPITRGTPSESVTRDD
ncbi:restriction endonuclease [Mesorhizobium sp. VK22B]|uniref:Restriction endonuclease n=1 Tax=Mesorhizobium captivum TaxID=3072319 RepID=A0ABU4Z7Y2_9HYPH|nr:MULTISPECIES: restriction endonuclease [unclassified Mesorhizobium]MDX8495316.1 restriction endonuclease [Mesorhizobium sp. VK22B]MDX8508723.1 restriction endonuclease [Mesorhizobium sp. VK22E]